MYYLYVLKLKNKKWYVGITKNFDRRYYQHKYLSTGSRWVKEHGISNVYSVEPINTNQKYLAEAYEQAKTIELIRLYGAENVRGGTHVSPEISQALLKRLSFYA
jgi:predicted GIY-YIG superfamily endonuclease